VASEGFGGREKSLRQKDLLVLGRLFSKQGCLWWKSKRCSQNDCPKSRGEPLSAYADPTFSGALSWATRLLNSLNASIRLPSGPFITPRLAKPKSLLIKGRSCSYVEDGKRGRYCSVIRLVEGSIFFAMVLLSINRNILAGVDSAGTDMLRGACALARWLLCRGRRFRSQIVRTPYFGITSGSPVIRSDSL